MDRKRSTEIAQDKEDEPVGQNSNHLQALQDTGFWGNMGAGAIFMAKDTGRILLAHRSASVEQPNTWGVWGGAIDKGERPIEAATREAQEEAGITPNPENIIPLYVFKHQSGFQYFNYLILVDHEFEPKSGDAHAWETQGHEWATFGKWPSPLHFGVEGILRDAKSNKILSELTQRFGVDNQR